MTRWPRARRSAPPPHTPTVITHIHMSKYTHDYYASDSHIYTWIHTNTIIYNYIHTITISYTHSQHTSRSDASASFHVSLFTTTLQNIRHTHDILLIRSDTTNTSHITSYPHYSIGYTDLSASITVSNNHFLQLNHDHIRMLLSSSLYSHTSHRWFRIAASVLKHANNLFPPCRIGSSHTVSQSLNHSIHTNIHSFTHIFIYK